MDHIDLVFFGTTTDRAEETDSEAEMVVVERNSRGGVGARHNGARALARVVTQYVLYSSTDAKNFGGRGEIHFALNRSGFIRSEFES
ncbi:hypothetical protein RRG08_008646 [Elysia crispata]|uniref:Uncharacterized protein n=1 Tax=Elysia crispata TaxID=231223 RepID=A0AAE0XYZ3_9GAST|nr:hypothetical protein RRG08_008646 [Elysia crispata]